MQKADYDALLRHSEMLKDLLKNLEKQYEFGSVAELEKARSIIQQVKAAISETNDALTRIDTKRKNVEKVRKYVDRITVVLAFLTVILVTFLGIYRNGQGVLLISFSAILLLLILTLIKNMAVTFIEIIAIFAIGTVFIITMYTSKLFQGFVTRYSAEIGAVSLLFALVMPWFTRLGHSTD